MSLNNQLLAGICLTGALVITIPTEVAALTGQEVNAIAQEVTVFIGASDGINKSQGSGVIIAKENNKYYVLTAHHVVRVQKTDNGPVAYGIITHDNVEHQISNITPLLGNSEIDLAVIEFESNQNYDVATLGNSDLVTPGVPVFVSGWPYDKALGRTTRQFAYGRVSTLLQPPYRGYAVGYDNNTMGGMSGGPVLDAGGKLIAIHGKADTDESKEYSLQSSGFDDETAAKLSLTGYNYGIPINTFLEVQSDLNLDVSVDNTPPPELLGSTEIASDTGNTIETNNFWGTFMQGLLAEIIRNTVVGGVCKLTNTCNSGPSPNPIPIPNPPGLPKFPF
jgi:serine protease Do